MARAVSDGWRLRSLTSSAAASPTSKSSETSSHGTRRIRAEKPKARRRPSMTSAMPKRP